MGGRLHLHLDSRRVAVCGGGAGPVLASHRGLVDVREHDLAARGGCVDDGGVAVWRCGGVPQQARADVFDYIERFYNPMRRHSTLGYVSPAQFEKARKA